MFKVEEIQFGRVSWYYQDVATDPSPAEMGRSRFTPLDLAARWIARRADWDKGSRVTALAGGNVEFARYLADLGIESIPLDALSEGYVYGGYLLAEAEAVWDLVEHGGLDRLHRFVFPFSKLLLAVQMSFAGNRGFSRVCEVVEAEKSWLAMSTDNFRVESRWISRELVLESPAVLARWICCRLQVGSEPNFAPYTVDRFVFDPDVMTTPIGRRVDSQAAAKMLSGPIGEVADRRGMLLLALSRNARI